MTTDNIREVGPNHWSYWIPWQTRPVVVPVCLSTETVEAVERIGESLDMPDTEELTTEEYWAAYRDKMRELFSNPDIRILERCVDEQ